MRSRKEFAFNLSFLSRERSGIGTEYAIETDPLRPKQSPDFGKSQNLIPARCEPLDHRSALFR